MTIGSTVSTSGQFIDLADARLNYEEHGAGDPLLLLHGGLVSSASWASVVPLLATRFRVITADSRGHGRSTNSAGRLSYRQLADDTVALIRALGVERPVVGGWSDGAQVAREDETGIRSLVDRPLEGKLTLPRCRAERSGDCGGGGSRLDRTGRHVDGHGHDDEGSDQDRERPREATHQIPPA